MDASLDRRTGGMAGNGVADACYEDTERIGEHSWNSSGKRMGEHSRNSSGKRMSEHSRNSNGKREQ